MNKVQHASDDSESLYVATNLPEQDSRLQEGADIPTEVLPNAEDLVSYNAKSTQEDGVSVSDSMLDKLGVNLETQPQTNGSERTTVPFHEADNTGSTTKSDMLAEPKGRGFTRIELQLIKKAEQARR